jgi:hypothetical protein
MQRNYFLCAVAALLLAAPVMAQPFNGLQALKDHSTQVYYSHGHEQRAATIARRVDKAMAYYQQLLDFKPEVTLLVLTAADWGKHTSFPVYGMPHYQGDKLLVVAAEDNAFWKSFLPPPEQLSQELRRAVQTTYKNAEGAVSMQHFFDLLALHELGHAFHFQGGLNMQRKWMGELFVNVLLHTYIAENEPEQLAALTLFPRMVVGSGAKEFTYTSLADVDERYEEIGQRHPKNYGWYQSRWHTAAGTIYDAAGKDVGRRLWDALKHQKERLSEEALLDFLSGVDTTVGDVMRNWERDTVR